VAAGRDRAPQHLVEDVLEREVHVVAGDVELDRRDAPYRHPLVDRLDQLAELVGREAA
jgi:hypothetical protein